MDVFDYMAHHNSVKSPGRKLLRLQRALTHFQTFRSGNLHRDGIDIQAFGLPSESSHRLKGFTIPAPHIEQTPLLFRRKIKDL